MAGTLLLDSEGLSKLYRKDPAVLSFIQAARQESVRVVTSTMTVVEADYERVRQQHANKKQVPLWPLEQALARTPPARPQVRNRRRPCRNRPVGSPACHPLDLRP